MEETGDREQDLEVERRVQPGDFVGGVKEMVLEPSAKGRDEIEKELLHAFKDGNEEAFVELYSRHEANLYNFIKSIPGMAGQRELYDLIEDINAWTWHDAFIGCGSYDPNKKFVTWLYKLSTNRTKRALHARKGSTTIDLDRWFEGAARSAERPIIRINVGPGENPEPQPDAMPGTKLSCQPFDENGTDGGPEQPPNIFGGMELGFSHRRRDSLDERFIPLTAEDKLEEVMAMEERRNCPYRRSRFFRSSASRAYALVESGRVKLTKTEGVIFRALWAKAPKNVIASELEMSDVTLKKHFSNISKKFRAAGVRIF